MFCIFVSTIPFPNQYDNLKQIYKNHTFDFINQTKRVENKGYISEFVHAMEAF